MSTLTAPNLKDEETKASALYAMPATPFQVRLWNLEHGPAANHLPNPAWNVAVRFRLAGLLDREKFESALQLLVSRHEALRTALGLHRGTVVQHISGWRSLPVEWCDLRALAGEAQADEAARLSLDHARLLQPLDHAPLFRVRVLRLQDEEHLLLMNAHHAVCDGWSVGLVARDLMEIYGSIHEGGEPAARNSLDYGDYAVWLDQQRHSPEYEAHRSYWKRRLRHIVVPELPPTWQNLRSSPAAPSIHSTLLPRALTNRLGALAQRHDATFFHAALAAFALLLRAQQDSPQVALGTPVSGRDQSELETIVGTFVNYVPLLFPVAQEQRYVDLLRSVCDLATDSLDHSRFRIEDMLAGLAPSAGAGAAESDLFSAAFICQQDFVRPIVSAGLSLTAVPSVSPGALRPLTVFMVERPDGWRLSCEVDNRRVSSAAGLRLLDNFERLIEAIVNHPEESVSALAARVGLVFVPSSPADFPVQPEPAAFSIQPSPGPVRIPATEAQLRFWLLDRLNPGDVSFDLAIRLELKGALNIDALRSAVEKLIERNEILRTTLEEVDNQVWQVIQPRGVVDFLSGPADASSADPTILSGDARKPFSLSAGPLFRVRLLQWEPDRHWLLITLSHAIADGWSSGLLLEQLRQSYEEALTGTRDPAQVPPDQFSIYAEAERDLLNGPEKERRLAWWQRRLEGTWMPLALPRDGEETVQHSQPRAAMLSTPLAPSAVTSARRFARESGTTLFAIFGAAFQALLARYSGQKDILFLTPFANRTGDTESVLGPLAVPVCLSGHVDAGTTFRELVAALGDQSLDALEHVLPFSLVAPLVDMRVVGGQHALNQIAFFHQRAFVHDMQWGALSITPLPEFHAATGTEWQLGIVERGDSVFTEFLYQANRYSEQTMSLVAGHYARFLAGALAEPDTSLSQLQFITAKEMADFSAGRPLLPVTQRLLPRSHHTAAAETAAPAPAAEQEPVALTQSQRDMMRIWRPLFKNEKLTTESNFFDLGGHSLLLARLQIAVKKEFNLQLSVADVFRHQTIGELAAWLDRSRSAAQPIVAPEVAPPAPAPNPRIIPIQPLGAGHPVFVISQSMIFRTLAAELGAAQPVYALQMLDEDITSEMHSASFEQLAGFYLRLIREVQPTGPYRLAGWCVSGWIAYGIARQLELQGEKVELLMVMDAWAPGYWSKQPTPRRLLMRLVYRGQRLRWVARRLRGSTMAQRRQYVQSTMHSMAAAAARNLTVVLHRMKLPVQVRLTEEMRRSEQLEYTASRAYDAGRLNGPILLFRSEEQPSGPLLADDMGWGKVLGRGTTVEVLPGDHHQIFDLPGAAIMAARAREALGIDARQDSVSAELHNRNAAKSSTARVPLAEVQ